MIQSVLSFTLHGFNAQLSPVLDVFQTVFLNRQTAIATVALASYSQGLENFQAGWAGAFITKAGVANVPGQTENLPLDPRDVNRTQIRIDNCVFVTFRLVLAKAEARATATVFVDGPALPRGLVTKSAFVHDRVSGAIKGVHHVAYPAGARAPSEALLLRRVRECAAKTWSVAPRTLGTTLVRKADPAFSSALIVDKRTRRVHQKAMPPQMPALIAPATIRDFLGGA